MKDFDVRWAAIAFFFAFFGLKIILEMQPGIDWMPLWVAGRAVLTDPAIIYDFNRITQLQPEIYRDPDFRPFVYPPSALLFITPLAQLPFWFSLALLSCASLFGLTIAAKRAGSDPVLLALAPPLVIATVVGQVSPSIICLTMIACLIIRSRERTAGTLLAVAALIKPTLFVLAPVALVAGRHWSAMVCAAATFSGGIAASILLFGTQPWVDWVAAVPEFQRIFAEYPGLMRNSISPFASAVRLGVEHQAIPLLFVVPALACTWIAFSRPNDPAMLLAILLGGALLISPYAMHYELAVFGPAMLALPRDRLLNVAIIATWAASLFLNAGVVGLAVAYAAVACSMLTARRAETQGKFETSR